MVPFQEILTNEETLDPQNWDEMRTLAHQMVDDMFNYQQNIRQEPVWRAIPANTKSQFKQPLPQNADDITAIYEDFKTHILPYPKGNIHPRFWAFVQGTGTPYAMMAEMLAASMNSNCAIGEHSAQYVEEQVIDWCKTMLNYPAEASGILLSGGSMANITAIVIARNAFGEQQIRKNGLRKPQGQLLLYTSTETHSCLQKGAEVAGLGTEAIRKIPVDAAYQMDTEALRRQISKDRADGFLPFCVVGNAGTVNTGAIDPLHEIHNICKSENLWFHIDGAFGALAKLVPAYRPTLEALEKADSVAFDLHKWLYMPYEVGCLLVKNKALHRDSFALQPTYLLTHERGLMAGPDPITNYGFELSRGFKALKVWMSFREHGIAKFARLIEQNIAQAYYLGSLVEAHPQLELLTPVTMNIVCYRYITTPNPNIDLNALNKEILMQLHEEGLAAPSSTMLKGQYALRVANVNHRSRKEDFDALVADTVRLGNGLSTL